MRQAIIAAAMFASRASVNVTAQITKSGVHAWRLTADIACLRVSDQMFKVNNALAQQPGNASPIRATPGGLLAPPLPIAVVLGLAVYFDDFGCCVGRRCSFNVLPFDRRAMRLDGYLES